MGKTKLLNSVLKRRGFSWLSPKVRLKKSGIQGRGLFATGDIRRGEVVNICGGAIITDNEYAALERDYGEFLFHYATQIADGFYLLGGLSHEELEDDDFINHSCSPNCGLNGQIAVVSMRDIKKGEELTIDYAMIDSGPWISFACRCGLEVCRKKISGNDWESPMLQKKYKGYFSWYIEEKIRHNAG